MHLPSTTLPFLLLLPTLTLATSLDPRANTCPNGVTNVNINGKHYCCPGSVITTNNDDGYCCVGGHVSVPSVSFCPGFPNCSGTTASATTSTTAARPSASCKTTIPFSATDYSSLAAAAAKSTGATAATQSSSKGSAASKSSSGGAGMPMVTRGPEVWAGVGLLGAMGVLGGL